jgi:hypothetical protein
MTNNNTSIKPSELDAEKLIAYIGDNKADIWFINESLANRKIKDLKVIELQVSEAILLCEDPLVGYSYKGQLENLERAVKHQINQIQSTPKKKSKNNPDRQKLTQDQLVLLFCELQKIQAISKDAKSTDMAKSIREVTDLDCEKTRQRFSDYNIIAGDPDNKKAVVDVLQQIIDKLK